MNASAILTADLLDILFEGKNKEYGAYQLRRTYNQRMFIAVAGMLALTGLLWAGYVISNHSHHQLIRTWTIEDPELTSLKETPPEKIPPPPVKIPAPKPVAMQQYTTTLIVKDEMVKPEEQLPIYEDLDKVKIGNITRTGPEVDDLIAPPPSDGGKGILQMPVHPDNPDSIFVKVEIESEYPGGLGAWARYLNKGVKYPQEAIDNRIQGTINVRFIVDKEGNVSHVAAIGGPEALQAEAVRVIRKSGQWTPAIQNGKTVNSFKTQPIVFKLAEE